MFAYKKIFFLALWGGAYCSALVAQSSDSISRRSFSYIRQSEAWLQSENAAGLRELPVEHISIAEIYAGKQDGKFVNYNQSANSYELGAETESFYRLNPKIVFYGKISYNYFLGKNMAGSVFIHPEDAPFDIVEASDENRGNKTQETYHLIGAVSADIAPKVTLGGKVDYTASNYAKQKDLRHVNKLLDMNVTAGVNYRPNRWVELGANYYYRRSTEGVLLSVYGTTDRIYKSLISYGAFFGTTEQFGEDGYTKSNEEKPMFNEYHGGAFQLKVNIRPQLSLFNELSYKSRSGYYGKKSTITVRYSDHESTSWAYNATLTLSERKNLHQLTAGFSTEKLNNLENIYRSENLEGGKNTINYYGTLDTTDKTVKKIRAAYTGNFGITDFCPTWVLRGGIEYYSRDIKASLYPYYRKQDIHQTAFQLSGERNFVCGKDMFSVLLGAGYVSGGGNAQKDGYYATPSESQTPPKTMDTYLYREYEYLTCNQLKAEAGVKYARSIGKTIQGYTSFRYALTKATDVKYLEGDQRHELRLTVGCTF